jgi:uncharacterized membrane protein YhiD involved in acid resistance
MPGLGRVVEVDLILRVLAAFALGGVIGLEREQRAKVAGLRTHMLVAGGAALFTVASSRLFLGLRAIAWPNTLVRLRERTALPIRR